MIVKFTVGNFLSFKDKKTISFEATSIKELPENVIKHGGKKLLRSIVVYGANSSGKSNLIKAMDRMKNLLQNSVKLNPEDKLDYSPFLLSTETEGQPTFFELEFFIEKDLYRYGFEYNETEIVSEWLFKTEKKKENLLFIREDTEILEVAECLKIDTSKIKLNENRLYLSLIAQLGIEEAIDITRFFENNKLFLSGLGHKFLAEKLVEKNLYGDELLKSYMKDLIFHPLKLGFKDYVIESDFINNKEVKKIKTIHNRYNKKREIVDTVSFDCENQESEGTKKIIDLAAPIIVTLMAIKNATLFIDEFDSKLHPILTQEIIKLFNNSKTNLYNSQLLFATHDTNLLSSELFRRDQIWFTEKDDVEQTDLYCLADMKLPDGSKVRNDSNLEKNYIRGRYGAIPYISNKD